MRLIAFGDSMVAGAGDPDHLGWIGRALIGRRAITLYNLGVRRETSADIAARWRAEATPRFTEDEPMRIVFSFGANDCYPLNGAPRVSQADSLKNAQAMLTGADAHCPVLLVGPPPMADPGVSARLEVLNENLKVLAARLKIPFIDVFQPLEADGLWRRATRLGRRPPRRRGLSAHGRAGLRPPGVARFHPGGLNPSTAH